MSQRIALEILEKLGGKATSLEVREKTKRIYPDRSLSSYITFRLNQLYKKGIVEKQRVGRDIIWEVKKR